MTEISASQLASLINHLRLGWSIVVRYRPDAPAQGLRITVTRTDDDHYDIVSEGPDQQPNTSRDVPGPARMEVFADGLEAVVLGIVTRSYIIPELIDTVETVPREELVRCSPLCSSGPTRGPAPSTWD